MNTYRIFTNDRGRVRGVPKYSCWRQVRAKSAAEAEALVHPLMIQPPLAPAKAIVWPPDEEGQKWMDKHV